MRRIHPERKADDYSDTCPRCNAKPGEECTDMVRVTRHPRHVPKLRAVSKESNWPDTPGRWDWQPGDGEATGLFMIVFYVNNVPVFDSELFLRTELGAIALVSLLNEERAIPNCHWESAR